MSPELRKYLQDSLDLSWGYDVDYCRTYNDLVEAWDFQNILRKNNGIDLLSAEELAGARKGKP